MSDSLTHYYEKADEAEYYFNKRKSFEINEQIKLFKQFDYYLTTQHRNKWEKELGINKEESSSSENKTITLEELNMKIKKKEDELYFLKRKKEELEKDKVYCFSLPVYFVVAGKDAADAKERFLKEKTLRIDFLKLSDIHENFEKFGKSYQILSKNDLPPGWKLSDSPVGVNLYNSLGNFFKEEK